VCTAGRGTGLVYVLWTCGSSYPALRPTVRARALPGFSFISLVRPTRGESDPTSSLTYQNTRIFRTFGGSDACELRSNVLRLALHFHKCLSSALTLYSLSLSLSLRRVKNIGGIFYGPAACILLTLHYGFRKLCRLRFYKGTIFLVNIMNFHSPFNDKCLMLRHTIHDLLHLFIPTHIS
jgi:hypothetical protein